MKKMRGLILSLSSLLAFGGLAAAQTITVTTAADETDVPTNATLADLPGPDGVVSFREALRASDNTPGHQTIGFAVPQADWSHPDLVSIEASLSFSALEPVTIDGTTQTAFTGDTNPNGNEVGIALQTYLNGDGCVVTGLHGTRVELNGSDVEVYENTGDMYLVLYWGSNSFIHDNEADTITLTRSHENVIVANTVQRIRITGVFSQDDPATNNRIGGPDLADRNYITGWGNYGEHGVPGGNTLELQGTVGTVVQNNYIGTTPDGMTIGSNSSTSAISIQGRNDGTTIRDNLIATRAVGAGPVSGVIYGWSIWVYGRGTGLDILNNTIGLNAAGEPAFGCIYGIAIDTLTFNTIDDFRIEGNEIAGHLSTGIFMLKAPGVSSQSIRLTENSIYGNGELGIDLTPNSWTFGVTPNDPLDADEGANGLQNFPELTSAANEAGALRVTGALASSPSASFTVEVFASPECGPTGFGEGQVFIGSTTVVTDASGHADLDVTFPGTLASDWVVTATATSEPDGATSEFSECVEVSSPVGTSYCTSLANSTGAASTIHATGSASVAANDLVLSADNLPAQPGVFIAGPTATQVPLFDGYLCIDPVGLQRFVTVKAPSGGVITEIVDLAASAAGGLNVTAGSAYHFQRWNRDPAAGGSGANFSDGLEVHYTP